MPSPTSKFPSYGLVRGPSHEHGGVAGMVADEQPVELEGGEWIIPKEVVPDYLPVLQQITNEGRAMQQMENGNSAMDALIASASMQNGLAQPKSPMYQEGGQVREKNVSGWRPEELNLEDIYEKEPGFFGNRKFAGTKVQRIFSIPASEVGGGEGKRYYYGEGTFPPYMRPSAERQAYEQARGEILKKMAFSPQDSIPAASVEGYFDELNKKAPSGFLKKLLGKKQGGPVYQDGGQVYDPMSKSLVEQSYFTPQFRYENIKSGRNVFRMPKR